jgi:DNA-directed RNA polymerase subunit L
MQKRYTVIYKGCGKESDDSFISKSQLAGVTMEVKIIESSANKLVFQLVGADHTFCNSLKKELVQVSGVELATYAIEHPQIGIPKVLIETKGKTSPVAALKNAIDSLKSLNKEFLAAFTKAAK